MNEKQKLLDLLDKKRKLIDEMEAADTANDQTAFDTAQEKITTLNAEISRVQAIIKEKENVPPPETPQAQKPVLHAFCDALRARLNGNNAAFMENRAVVNEGMTEGSPEAGGLLVPTDIQTKINELRRTLNPLANLFNVETVTAISGERVTDAAPETGFSKIGELEKIKQDDKPTFRQIKYTVDKYALIVPISNELIKDSDENVLAYLTRWFAKKGVLTENKLLLELLAKLDAAAVTAAAGKELAAIKEALNVTLDPAISLTSSFVTNQSGFNYLDTLEDKVGRPLLQPDPTNGTRKMLLARPIHVMSDAVLPNLAGGAPLYIGDFRQYGTLFRRKNLEVDITNIGGDAWFTDSTEVRGIMRLGAEIYDGEAAAEILLAKATVGA